MSIEEMLKKIMADQAQLAADARNNQLPIQNLEKQFGHLASAQNSRPQRGLPGNTDPNPKQVNAVGTRSGLQLKELAPKKRNTNAVNKESEPKEGEVVAQEERVQPICMTSTQSRCEFLTTYDPELRKTLRKMANQGVHNNLIGQGKGDGIRVTKVSASCHDQQFI
uniref:Integrase core domain containing protein n=1 Tax=Solanum tuberosum TaxID=4113 RepID=M1DJL4_SOLTU